METTYTIQGGDGNQYGPATLAQIKEWIAGGRVGANTQVLRSDQPSWQPAGSFAELNLPPVTAVPAPPLPGAVPVQATPELLALEARIKSGASWFYWIAVLSLINSVVALTGSGYGFIVGLGITQFIDAIGKSLGSAGTVVALGLDLAAAAVLFVFGIFAGKRHSWAFIVGMALYGLDGLLFLIVGDWLALGFHGFALFCIFSGYQAMRKHQEIVPK
jgi:hypothetical protein